ncbi:DUF2591 domain-containing protein [Pseudomonas sp. 21LCFQ010]|uniref:phage protein NinX family protein n=1 Tax=Pseudomonas sp. 21LCFQ010 TaxID=2957506 RepID=UPI002096A3F0|nr:phage protein NinX family protein [Pseudomonas sp. 21LCFQ010]MCO8161048.1 DUF2591 domain-containing protein [Pseudomonas sp. 21LCFQ010]
MTNMIEVKAAELTGAALDWAVAMAVKAWTFAHAYYPTMTVDPTFSGVEVGEYPRGEFGSMVPTCILVPRNSMRQDPQAFCPSTDWSQGGPLIATHRVSVIYSDETCDPCAWTDSTAPWHGDTPLIAACRAIVASKLGDTVQIPAELLP